MICVIFVLHMSLRVNIQKIYIQTCVRRLCQPYQKILSILLVIPLYECMCVSQTLSSNCRKLYCIIVTNSIIYIPKILSMLLKIPLYKCMCVSQTLSSNCHELYYLIVTNYIIYICTGYSTISINAHVAAPV